MCVYVTYYMAILKNDAVVHAPLSSTGWNEIYNLLVLHAVVITFLTKTYPFMKQSSPNQQTNGKRQEMNSLSMCLNKAVKQGFITSFIVNDDGRLHIESRPESYTPEQVQIVNFYRFEGASDPADNSILYLIETSDGTKGVLIDAYGAYAQEHISQFIKQVEDIQKQEHPGQ